MPLFSLLPCPLSLFAFSLFPLREQRHLPARMPEQYGRVLVKLSATDACDETGHRFRGVRRIEKERFGPGGQLYRLARLSGGHAVTRSNKSVVHGNARRLETIGREPQELGQPAEQHSHISFE